MPGKHKNRKRNRPRRIQLSIKRLQIPAGVSNEESIKVMQRSLKSGDPLPEDWDVEISWRNPNTKVGRSKDWQSGEWSEVLQDSSGSPGFSRAVGNALRVAAGQPIVKPKADKRQGNLFVKPKQTAKQTKAKPKTAAAVFSKRSAAAKKGWATRRANQAKGKTK